MTTIAGLVRTLHDIDAAKGRVCGACTYGNAGIYQLGRGCRKGYEPACREDSCTDWLSKYPDAAETHQRPRHEAGEAAE